MEIKKTQKLEKKGDSCLKTGLFKWNKDLAGAATYYDQAIENYMKLKAYDEVSSIYFASKPSKYPSNSHIKHSYSPFGRQSTVRGKS